MSGVTSTMKPPMVRWVWDPSLGPTRQWVGPTHQWVEGWGTLLLDPLTSGSDPLANGSDGFRKKDNYLIFRKIVTLLIQLLKILKFNVRGTKYFGKIR